jgi:hypothetical protein
MRRSCARLTRLRPFTGKESPSVTSVTASLVIQLGTSESSATTSGMASRTVSPEMLATTSAESAGLRAASRAKAVSDGVTGTIVRGSVGEMQAERRSGTMARSRREAIMTGQDVDSASVPDTRILRQDAPSVRPRITL